MTTKIPVTVITGFLGSGKTTLIRYLLQHNQGRRIAVLVNEFGELGIDGELLRSCQICPEDVDSDSNIVELNNGCLCCTVQEEFLPTMLQLLKRRDKLDAILIETSGLALPKPLIKACRWPEIRNAATVDAVITVVDCQAVASGTFASNPEAVEQERQADPNLTHETPLQELFEDQLTCADLVVLTKLDLVEAATQAAVTDLIQQHLPRVVKIVPAFQGQIDPAVLLGLGAAVEEDLDARPSHHDSEEDHDHDDEITSTHVVLPQSFDPVALQHRLQQLVQQQEIYRIKGFVAVPNKSMRLVVQGVGTRFEQFYDRHWQAEEPQQTQLVFIGRALNPAEIESQLMIR